MRVRVRLSAPPTHRLAQRIGAHTSTPHVRVRAFAQRRAIRRVRSVSVAWPIALASLLLFVKSEYGRAAPLAGLVST